MSVLICRSISFDPSCLALLGTILYICKTSYCMKNLLEQCVKLVITFKKANLTGKSSAYEIIT